jgi:hypothetical protein
MRAHIGAAGPCSSADLPEIEIAVAGVVPEQIAGAVVIEIA